MNAAHILTLSVVCKGSEATGVISDGKPQEEAEGLSALAYSQLLLDDCVKLHRLLRH
jgi:hypothetical protein